MFLNPEVPLYFMTSVEENHKLSVVKNAPNERLDCMQFKNIFTGSKTDDLSHSYQMHVIKSDTTESTCSFSKLFPSKPKPCNCAKSHCLKLYCECFAQRIQCNDCNCVNCLNNDLHEEDRLNAIKLTLERNPLAFHSKFGDGEYKRLKGCTCKRSQCLKKYCECYEAKISCSRLCRCQGCRNVDYQRQQHSQAEPFYSASQTLPLNKRSSNMDIQDSMKYKRNCIQLTQTNQSLDRKVNPSVVNLPYVKFHEDPVSLIFLPSEFVGAACNLILLQLIEAKLKNFSLDDQEKVIIEEFGRCLLQIVNLLSNTPFSECNYNPDYTTLLSFPRGNILLQTTNQDQGSYEQSLNYSSRTHQTNQHLVTEYGLKNAEYYQNVTFDGNNGFDSTKHENSLPTIERWYNFEKYKDSQVLYSYQNQKSDNFVTRVLEHCDTSSVSEHQPRLFEIHNRDTNQGYSEVECPVVHQPESYVSSTDAYFFRDVHSPLESNNESHSQTLNTRPISHSNIQYSESTDEPKMINPIEATIGNISNTSEYLTEIYSEDEETSAATNALLGVPTNFDYSTYILSSEINLSEVAETSDYTTLCSNETSSNTTDNEKFITKSFIENRCSPSAVYGLDFISELEFYNS